MPVKCEREAQTETRKRLTFVVTCSAAGQMLKPMVIFKGKTARSLKSKTKRNDIVIGHQKKGWMDHAQMLAWIREVLVKHTKKKHVLLVFNSFKAYLVDDVLQALIEESKCVNCITSRWLHQQSTSCGCVPKSANQRHNQRPVGSVYDQYHGTRPDH